MRGEIEQSLADARGHLGIEGRRGLVQDEQPGPVQGGLHDPHQRPLPGGELCSQRRRQMADGKTLQRLVDRPRGVLQAVEIGVHAQELPHAQALGERQVAGGEPDLGEGASATVGQAVANEVDGALVGRHDSEKHEEGRRLAGPIGAEQRHALSGSDVQADVGHRRLPPKEFGQSAGTEHGVHVPTMTGDRSGAFWLSSTSTTARILTGCIDT